MHISIYHRWKSLLLFAAVLGVATPAAAELVLAAPPRESEAKGTEAYDAVASYLSTVLGEKVTYTNPTNWLTYQSNMRKGVYDIVFDGPAFVAWRMHKQQHVPLVKLPGQLSFVVVVKKDDQRIKAMSDLAGRTVCGMAPPNHGTLTLQYEFSNPSRQPLILETKSFKDSYQGVVSGKCLAAVVHAKIYAGLEAQAPATRVIFTSRTMANQAITVGPKIPAEKHERLTQALLSPAGKAATLAVLEQFKAAGWLPAKAEEYEGLQVLLKDVWGFSD
jgi:ABC-type phosphate/phosphonate transport system substrate-binding protein